jgi:F-type H+-transporting ATPase subunit delta
LAVLEAGAVPHQRTKAVDVATDEPLMASVAGRYASALFELASDEGKVAEVEGDLAKFQALSEESADFVRVIRSPVISSDEQEKAISTVLAKAGLGPLTINFFKLLAKNRRLFAAADVVRDFQSLAARARGEVRAEVTAASPLSDAQVADLKAALKASVGKDVTLVQKVDPSILGGLIVKLGSRMVDNSLKTKLEGMKFALKGSA